MARISIGKKQGRYEIRQVLAEGGMGRVYIAFDTVLKREVTLKTVLDVQDKTVLDLFRRESAVLAQMAHPNIVEIFDIGETDEKEPYFVMPLLKGVTLDQLIRSSSPRLTVERSIQMISQACRGLQAAHDQGMIHRDLKPGNLFVLEDDSLKIIDFGVAHLTDQRSATGLKGTLSYMSPEQLQLRKLEPWSDQFSLAIISYETLTRRHPFASAGREDIAQAIIHYSPPPASEINNLIPPAVSQVIHKALAKEPFHRFSNVREYSDCLQKAFRGEMIEIFNPAKIEPRLQRARKAFDSGDLDFAAEITRQLKSESYLSPEIDVLDTQILDSIRTINLNQLLETARRRFQENEYVLALQKLQEILNLDPQNTEANTLKVAIEGKRGSAQIEEWFHLAEQHVENNAYSHARQALEKVLEIRPQDSRAGMLLSEVNRREQEFNRLRSEKQQAYQSALEAYERGDVKSALSKLERVLELDRRAPHITSPEQTPAYQKLYQEVRSKHDELKSMADGARKQISDGNFQAAFAICDEALASNPKDLMFRALRDDAEQGQRQEISAYVANVEREVGKEPDLNRRVTILESAKTKYPNESRFEQSLQQVRSRKGLVDSIIARAHSFEDIGQFTDALGQWESLRDIHPQYPGLDVELERLRRRRADQIKSDAKGGWIAQIDQAIGVHNLVKASGLIGEALREFPGDPELLALEKSTKHFLERQSEAEQKVLQSKELDDAGQTEQALQVLREAFKIDPHSSTTRSALLELLLKRARALLDTDWDQAEPYLKEASDLEPKNALAKSLRTLVEDKKQGAAVATSLLRAREFQGEGRLNDAIAELDKGLAAFPKDSRLLQLRTSLLQSLSTDDRHALRGRDLQELKQLEVESKKHSDIRQLETIFERTRIYAKYQDDPEFRSPLSAIEQRFQSHQTQKQPVDAKLADAPRRPAVAAAKLPTAKNSSPTRNWKLWGIGAAAALVTLLPVAYLIQRTDPAPIAVKMNPVVVTISQPGDSIRVEDSKGSDVSAILQTPGLNPGTYKIKATRKGYRPAELTLNVTADEPAKTVTIPWDRLPTKLFIRHATANSPIEVGNATFQTSPTGDLEQDLQIGVNLVSWKSPTNPAVIFAAEVLVENGKVAIQKWNLKPTFSVLVTRIDAESVAFESFGYYRNILFDGKPYVDQGVLPDVAGKPFVVQYMNKTTLGEFPALGTELSSAIYFDLFPPPAQGRPNVVSKPAQAPIRAEDPPVPQQKRALTPEEIEAARVQSIIDKAAQKLEQKKAPPK